MRNSILSFMEKQKLCATDMNNKCGMVNAQAIYDFIEGVESGRDAALTVYQVSDDGGFLRNDIISKDEQQFVLNTRVAWIDDEPEITFQVQYELSEVRLTEKDNLIFTCIIPGNPGSGFSHDGYSTPSILIRTAPIDTECAALCKKYIKPISYRWGNLFTVDWSEGNMQNIRYDEVYCSIYAMYSGVELWVRDIGQEDDALQGYISVPESDFQMAVCSYLPISKEELREISGYDSSTGTYQAYIPYRHRDFDLPTPEPEVTGYSYNDDGTLTLFVDAVFLDNATDRALSHEVTIWPEADGSFHYLSNKVLYAGKYEWRAAE